MPKLDVQFRVSLDLTSTALCGQVPKGPPWGEGAGGGGVAKEGAPTPVPYSGNRVHGASLLLKTLWSCTYSEKETLETVFLFKTFPIIKIYFSRAKPNCVMLAAP